MSEIDPYAEFGPPEEGNYSILDDREHFLVQGGYYYRFVGRGWSRIERPHEYPAVIPPNSLHKGWFGPR